MELVMIRLTVFIQKWRAQCLLNPLVWKVPIGKYRNENLLDFYFFCDCLQRSSPVWVDAEKLIILQFKDQNANTGLNGLKSVCWQTHSYFEALG
jgi:hypothetical protein